MYEVASGPTLKYPMKIWSHNILLEKSLQDNDFGTKTFDDYLNFSKIFIPREAIKKGAMLKFQISLPSLKAFKRKHC